MTRNESDREDLMREAVALTERLELRCAGFAEPVTIGFRSHGALSVFLGQDPVYQFDPESRLRRAYVGGFLFRSQHTTLARLTRRRTATETVLQRQDLASEELVEFRQVMTVTLQTLLQAIVNKPRACEILRCVGDSESVLIRATQILKTVVAASGEWLSPTIRARK